MWHLCVVMSRAKKVKGSTAKASSSPKAVQWKGLIPVEVMECIRFVAERDERTVPVTIVRLLKASLVAERVFVATPPKAFPKPVQPTQPVMTPRQAQAVPPPPPPTTLQELVEDEEGWEGTAPAALGGTKVKI